jgi:hypothetical protein
MSQIRAKALTLTLFLLGLAIVTFLQKWWPEIMLIVGIPLALQQYLLGKFYDTLISLLVFVGAFVTIRYNLSFEIFLPVLLTLGAIYLFFREYLEEKNPFEDQKEEDINLQIEEDEEKKK